MAGITGAIGTALDIVTGKKEEVLKESIKVIKDMNNGPCVITEGKQELFETILGKAYTTEGNFESILVTPEPIQKEISTILDSKEYEDNNDKKPLEVLFKNLLQDDKDLKEIPDIPKSSDAVMNIPEPKIKTPLEKILLNIEVNKSKLEFLESQNYLLEKYFSGIFHNDLLSSFTYKQEFLSTIGNKTFTETFKDIDIPENPVLNFINTFPSVISDVKFYMGIIKKHEKDRRDM